jgi:hypothetical protein
MFGLFKNNNDFEDELYLDHKKKLKTLYITFGIIAFIVFNLIMYLMISY